MFYKQNLVIFDDFHEKSLHFHCDYESFLIAIFTFQNSYLVSWNIDDSGGHKFRSENVAIIS